MKYDLKFKINKTEFRLFTGLKMSQLTQEIIKQMKETFDIEIKVNNQICYNLISRPSEASRLLAGFCIISKCQGVI